LFDQHPAAYDFQAIQEGADLVYSVFDEDDVDDADDDYDKGDDDEGEDEDDADDDDDGGSDLPTFCQVAFLGPPTRLKSGGRHSESQDEDVPV
jgi:hypothetical protein